MLCPLSRLKYSKLPTAETSSMYIGKQDDISMSIGISKGQYVVT